MEGSDEDVTIFSSRHFYLNMKKYRRNMQKIVMIMIPKAKSRIFMII